VGVRKGKWEQFHVKEKQEFWEKGRRAKVAKRRAGEIVEL